jgi:hypothetical protein
MWGLCGAPCQRGCSEGAGDAPAAVVAPPRGRSQTRYGGDEHGDDIIGETQTLASLSLQLDEHLCCIVAEASEADYSRHEIVATLAGTTSYTRHRYNTATEPNSSPTHDKVTDWQPPEFTSSPSKLPRQLGNFGDRR